MRAPLVTDFLEEAEYEGWNAFVERSPQGSAYSLPAYLSALCAGIGGRFRILATKNPSVGCTPGLMRDPSGRAFTAALARHPPVMRGPPS